MKHKQTELKVKRNTLAAEARVIRNLARAKLRNARRIEAKYNVAESAARLGYLSLAGHNRHIVRPEARCTHLAAMFLKGVPLEAVENPCLTKTFANRKRVEDIIKSFSTEDSRVVLQQFAEWWDNGRGPEAQAQGWASYKLLKAAQQARNLSKLESRQQTA